MSVGWLAGAAVAAADSGASLGDLVLWADDANETEQEQSANRHEADLAHVRRSPGSGENDVALHVSFPFVVFYCRSI
jgi:hypothetical protein